MSEQSDNNLTHCDKSLWQMWNSLTFTGKYLVIGGNLIQSDNIPSRIWWQSDDCGCLEISLDVGCTIRQYSFNNLMSVWWWMSREIFGRWLYSLTIFLQESDVSLMMVDVKRNPWTLAALTLAKTRLLASKGRFFPHFASVRHLSITYFHFYPTLDKYSWLLKVKTLLYLTSIAGIMMEI